MTVKTFENNGKSISEKIVKLKLEQNIKSMLYNHLAHICAEETGSLPDTTENSL